MQTFVHSSGSSCLFVKQLQLNPSRILATPTPVHKHPSKVYRHLDPLSPLRRFERLEDFVDRKDAGDEKIGIDPLLRKERARRSRLRPHRRSRPWPLLRGPPP